MSAKKAKQLRKLTQAIVMDKLAKGENVSDETLYVEMQKNRKIGLVPTGKLGEDPIRTVISAGTILTTPGSVRGIYKVLKKQIAKGERK